MADETDDLPPVNEIPSNRSLKDKNLIEVLEAFSEKEFDSGDPDLEKRPQDMVPENYAIIDEIQGFYQMLANTTNNNYGDILRIVTNHGFTRYVGIIGNEIEESFNANQQAIFNRTRSMPPCKINLEECENKHTSFQLEKTISGAIGAHSRYGCIPKYKLVTIIHCYSTITIPGIEQSEWYPIFSTNIQKFEKKQRERMG